VYIQLAAKLKAAMDSNQDAQAVQILDELKVRCSRCCLCRRRRRRRRRRWIR
jgi:hypothetical protein